MRLEPTKICSTSALAGFNQRFPRQQPPVDPTAPGGRPRGNPIKLNLCAEKGQLSCGVTTITAAVSGSSSFSSFCSAAAATAAATAATTAATTTITAAADAQRTQNPLMGSPWRGSLFAAAGLWVGYYILPLHHFFPPAMTQSKNLGRTIMRPMRRGSFNSR